MKAPDWHQRTKSARRAASAKRVAALLQMALLCGGVAMVAQGSAGQSAASPQAAVSEPATLSRGETLMRDGRFAEAEGELRRELQSDAKNASLRYALAYSLLRQDRAPEALEQYTQAAALRPPHAAELVNVGQAYVLVGDYADADKWTLRAVRMTPDDPETWYSLGRIRYTEQRFADAAACFRRVLEVSPRNAKAEDNLGLALESMNRTEDAVAAYRQAIAWADPSAAPESKEQPRLNLATVLLHRGELKAAEPLLLEAAALVPTDWHVHEQLGHLYLQRPDFALAADEFRKATVLAPENASLHFLLGQAYRRLGRPQEADAEFARSTQLSRPASPGVQAK